MRPVLQALDRWVAAGQACAIATIVQVHGSAPLPVSTIMAVRRDGLSCGSVSGGCVEAEVVAAAAAIAAGSESRRLRFAPTDDPLTSTALPCGGGIDVLVEPWLPTPAQGRFAAEVLAGRPAVLHSVAEPSLVLHEAGPRPRLVLVGAGPVAAAICALSAGLGWHTVVIDPREAFIARGSLAGADEVVPRWPAEALARIALGPGDALLALSHHPALDDEALAQGVIGRAGFVGALGSRRSHASRLERLAARGLSEAELRRIIGPIGLDLGGWSPGEIALAVMGELVAVRHGRSGGRLVDGHGAIHAPAGAPDEDLR